MIDTIKSVKPWQTIALVAVLMIGIGASYAVYAVVTRSDEADLGENQRLIPVTRGDLVNEVSINGSLAYPIRETPTFGAPGVVGELLVEEGQEVEAGQRLATLDMETVATLEKAVGQARVNLRDAEEAFAKANNPHTALDMAQAEVKVSDARLLLEEAQDNLATLLEPSAREIAQAETKASDARLALADVQETLATLLEPTAQDIAQAETKASDARLALADAQEALARLLEPTAQDIAQVEAKVASAKGILVDAQEALAKLLEPPAQDVAQAETAVVNANIAVEDAQEALEAARDGAGDDDIAEARSQVDTASTILANAQRDLELVQNEWDDKMEVARESLQAVLEDYQAVFEKWLGIDVGDEKMDQDPDTLLGSWGVELTSLFGPDSRSGYLGWTAQTPTLPRDDPNTPWNESVVFTWSNLYPGSIVATCENEEVPSQGACVGKELDDAWDALDGARDDLGTVETQAAKAIANAEIALTRAGESRQTAQDSLAELEEPAGPLQIEAREKQLDLALVVLQMAKEELSTLNGEPDDQDVDVTLAQLALAQADLNEAVAELAELTNGPDPVQLETKQNLVVLARANLDHAETELTELIDRPDPLELDAAQNLVTLARANLDQAETELAVLTDGPDPLELDAAQKEVEMARANVDEAETELAELTNGPSSAELEVKQDQVAVAKASLAEAEEELAELRGSVDPLEVALRKAELASALAVMDGAIRRLDSSIIKAPWNGIVTAVNVDVGQTVNGNTAIVEIVDPSVVEVDGVVDEIDVLFIREGAQASVTMDALPDQVLDGSVGAIAPEAQSQQGVVTYPISIRVQVPPGLDLPEGLSAVASVVIREARNVLLVPLGALTGTFDQPVVRVMADDRVEERQVVLGNSDDFWAVVQEGLAEGELVVMEAQQASTTGFGGFRGLIPGGAGRGRGQGGPGR